MIVWDMLLVQGQRQLVHSSQTERNRNSAPFQTLARCRSVSKRKPSSHCCPSLHISLTLSLPISFFLCVFVMGLWFWGIEFEVLEFASGEQPRCYSLCGQVVFRYCDASRYAISKLAVLMRESLCVCVQAICMYVYVCTYVCMYVRIHVCMCV